MTPNSTADTSAVIQATAGAWVPDDPRLSHTDQPAGNEQDRIDAERWRVLWSSDRIRMMGCAGFDFADDGTVTVRDGDGWAHMGMEVWDKHPAKDGDDDVRGRKVLLAYVEARRAAAPVSPAVGGDVEAELAVKREKVARALIQCRQPHQERTDLTDAAQRGNWPMWQEALLDADAVIAALGANK